MIITQFSKEGNLINILSNNFNDIFWKEKIKLLFDLMTDLNNLHKLGYKDFHSRNILKNYLYFIFYSMI